MLKNNENNMSKKHPSAFEPATIALNIIVSVLGAIIGLELITRLGISTNTSIVGALLAILIARIPLKIFRNFKDINRQNLIQTSISGATFSAANGLLLPIGIPYLMGRPDLVMPMLIGAILAVITDATILYFSFDTEAFPAKAAWPPGIAAAEAILAAAQKGKKAMMLLYGIAGGIVGKYLGIPTDVFGVTWIGNAFALLAFGVGLIVRGYVPKYFGIDLDAIYLPHGVMIGAGLVALIQIIKIVTSKSDDSDTPAGFTRSLKEMKRGLGRGYIAYLAIALILALIGGIASEMSMGMLILWIVFAALAAIASELIVGIAAMHSGWFPAFATALIFLVIGMLIGFPPLALALLVGFTACTGPAFADMAYDLKAGWILRGEGKDSEFEKQGRKQQYFAELLGFIVSFIVVAIAYRFYFAQDLFAPVNRVYVATIEAGASMAVAKNLLIWAIPGAIIQFLGGPDRQLGVLFATGLLINFPVAGITVIIGLIIRYLVVKRYKEEGQSALYVLGAGFIAGSAIYSFFSSTLKLGKK
ncbi:OPT/YSL family transporter [Maledivibacter halophilus]|uniref:Uncharacterized membrane protein, oligopeptide transporter (OPT) family n=1 Tax=Maledivibacter halophilus TaxID=36842 RepID=A0A1T5L2M5_9FIRM|nr:OPT/YSL family transporter [Maledivibacter halophilus]SKC70277.1 Uncharacterized membrane protein, oligopeptide transporter (OPT) family [Maledivibacter halophilus]